MGLGQRLIGVTIRPQNTFEDIDENPSILVPAFVILGIQLIISLITLPKVLESTLIFVRQQPTYQPAMESLIKTSTVVSVVAGATLMPIITWLAFSALLKLLNIFAGNDASFKNILSVNIFAHLPALFRNLVRTIIMSILNTGNVNSIQTSLALLLPTPANPAQPSLLYIFLAQFDFFTIWSLILTTIGTSVVFRNSKNQSAAMVFGIFLFFVLCTTGFSFLSIKLST